MGTVLVGSPGRVISRKVVAEPLVVASSLVCGVGLDLGVAFLVEDLGLGEGFFVEDVSVGEVGSLEGSSMVDGSGAGVGAEAAFLVFDADFVFGGMLSAAEGLFARAFFVADLTFAVFVVVFAVEASDAGFEVELVERGLSPGLMAG